MYSSTVAATWSATGCTSPSSAWRRRARQSPSAENIGQRHVAIREQIEIDSAATVAGAYQLLNVVVHIPDVGVHAGEHATVLHPERNELRRLPIHDVGAAAEHHAVVAARLDVSRVLHAEVVLV